MADRYKFELRNIRRLNQFTNPEAMGETEVPVLENAVLDIDAGKAIKRGAFSKGSYGGPLGAVPGITDVFSTRLAYTNYIVVKLGSSLYQYSGGSWSAVTGITTLDATSKLQTQVFNDRLYLTDGVSSPRMTDLASGQSMEITPPVVSGLDSYHKSGGNLGVGQYKYVITHRTPEGDESNPSRPFTHYFSENYENSNSTSNTYKSLRFTGIPAVTDSRVNTRVIYRTEVNGDLYYRWGVIDADTTEFIDTKADSELDLAQAVNFVNVPSVVKDLTSHRERLFVGGVTLTQKNYIQLPHDPEESADDGNWLGGGSWFATTSNLGGTSFTPQNYGYRVVLVSEEGIYSDYEEKTFSLSGTFDIIDLGNIPQLRINGNLGNVYEVYRKDGGGSWLYHDELSSQLNSGFRTDLIDTKLSLSGNKTWTDPTYDEIDYNNAVMWSDIGQPTNFQALSILRVFPDDGDLIIAIYDDRDGILVFKENSICKIYTQGNPINWRVVKVTEEVGCDDINSIHKTEDRYYFQQFKQVYQYPVSVQDAMSLGIKDELGADDNVMSTAYSSRLKWLFVNVENNGVGKTLVWDEEIKGWYIFKYTNWYITAMCEVKQGTDRGYILWCNNLDDNVGLYDRETYRDYDGADDSQTYEMRIRSKTWLTPDLKYAIRFTKLFSRYQKEAGQNVNHLVNNIPYIDSIGSGGKYIEASDVSLTHATEITYEIYGEGLQEFTYSQIEYYMTRRRLDAVG